MVKKLLMISILALSIFTCLSCAKDRNLVKDALPSGTHLDETKDVISLSDLSLGGLVNQEVIKTNENTSATFDRLDPEGSLVFKFKYDVVDASTSDSNAIRIHLDVADDKWNSDASVWFRGDGTYLAYYNGEKFKWRSNPALTLGMHEIEMGLIALFDSNDVLTGNYYLYYKVDGVEIDSYVNPYDLSKMDGDMFINFSSGNTSNKVYDIKHIEGPYEIPDRISVKDLTKSGSSIGELICLSEHNNYSYNSTAEHKSVVFSFLYDALDYNTVGIQFHFNNTWIGSSHGGIIWLRNDKNRISKTGGGYLETDPFKKNGLYEVELSKLYITSGTDQGKYYLSLKVDGVKKLEYIIDDMPDSNYVFMTGTNGDYIYDLDYLPITLDTDLYLYKWDAKESGIEFSATIRKDILEYHGISEAGFIIYPQDNPTDQTVLAGKLKEVGNDYIVKAALAGLNSENITRMYSAKLYYTMPNNNGAIKTYYTKAISSSFYDELDDLSSLSEKDRTILSNIKDSVLNVTINPDTCAVTNATRTGDFASSTIKLKGTKATYNSFVLNGEFLKENYLIMIGYYTYKVSLSSNEITLTKQSKKMIYGGSEHFVELNSGHDEKMTAINLSPMASELGLKTIRLDIDFGNLFKLNQDNSIAVNYGYLARVNGVMDELKENGGIVDFLAVVQAILPYGYKTWSNKPWTGKTAPYPGTTEYETWLRLNYECMKKTAELFPELHYFETWNEPEIMSEEDGPLAKPDGTNYSVTEKAKIMTDLMYYYNKAIKEVNPRNMLTTPSICCSQRVDTEFDCTSPDFLNALYLQITDSTPVTGFSENDTDPNNYFQIINVHPYLTRGTSMSNWSQFMTSFHTVSANYGDSNTEIWITEFGFAQNRESNVSTKFMSVLNQADNLEFLTRIYFYKIHDYTDKIDVDRWGLYDYDGNIKSIGTQVKNFIKSKDE